MYRDGTCFYPRENSGAVRSFIIVYRVCVCVCDVSPGSLPEDP